MLLDNLSFTDDKHFEQRTSRAKPEPGDLIITREAPMGEVCIIPEGVECCLGQRMVLIKPDIEKVDSQYLLYSLMSEYAQIQISKSNGTGSIVSNLRIPVLKELLVPSTKLTTQRMIGNVLGAIDKKIDLNNNINAELEAMAKLIYDYWFVQFDFPDTNGNPYKSSGGKMIYHETLKREIPDGWSVNNLCEWIESDKTGDWGKETEQGNYTLQVDCIRGADINGLNGKGEVKAPHRFILQKNEQKILSSFDLIIEISGGSPTQSTGRMAFLTEDTLDRFQYPIICSNFCKAISLQNNNYFYSFIYQWNAIYDNGILFGWEGKTSGIKNLLFDSFVSKHPVCLPPEPLAKRFKAFIEPLQARKQKSLRENSELETLRDWLLPMLMNGQVTVKDS